MTRYATAAEFYAAEIDRFRLIYEAGHLIGLFDAVKYCASVDMPLPQWTALAVLNVIQEHHQMLGGRGGQHSAKGRLGADVAHFKRWNALRLVLRLHGLTELPKGRGRRVAGALTGPMLLAEAKLLLENRPEARIGNDAREIARSYRLVEASRNAGEGRFLLDELLSLF